MSFMFNPAINRIIGQSLNLDTDTLKVMLLNDAGNWTPDRDDEFVDFGAGNAPLDDELNVTNYTGGFAGGGRKTASITTSQQDANDRIVIILQDITWTTLGGASNDIVTAGVLIKEVTNDTDSQLIAYFDVPNTLTDGTNFTIDYDQVDGNIRFNNV